MKSPGFFILGAPKCGTTAMATYLKDHPRIFMCTPKEPLYFCEDFPGARLVSTEAEYLALFREVPPGTQAVGEASAMYLFSKVAAARIRAFAPNARVVVMVRNPIDLAVAYHAQQLYALAEDETEFATAWRLQEVRRRGESIPRGCRTPEFLQYREIGLLGEQLERVYSVFAPEQVHVVVFDDLARDAGSVYRDVLDFLQVEDDGRRTFEKVYATPAHRSRLLGRLTQLQPGRLLRVAKSAKGALGLGRVSALDWLRRANSARAEKPTLPLELHREMRESFRADVSRLGDLIGRDLSHWLDD